MLKNRIQQINRSLKIVWASSPKWASINAIVVLFKGFLPIVLIYVIKVLIDEITDALNSDNYQIETLYYALATTGIIFIVNAILSTISGLINEKHSYFINDYIQNIIHKRTTTLDYSNYEDVNFQNIYFRAINESSHRPSRIYFGFIRIIKNSITLILIAGILSSLHWGILLILALISIPIIFIRLKYSNRLFNLKKDQSEQERIVNYHHKLLTSKEFAKELRIFNLSELFLGRYEILKNELRGRQFAILKKNTKYEILIQLFASLVLFTVFGFITKSALDGDLSQGAMVMYLLALYRGYGFLNELLSSISSIIEDGLFLNNFYEFIDFRIVKNKQVRSSNFPSILKAGIKINNLSFKYPNSKRSVFNNLNLHIKSGETVAIVGTNGAGKTTLIKLICGLYECNKGNITMDDIDVSTISQKSISKNISVIFQDFMLYNTTAKENIWFGDITSDIEEDKVEDSAKKSGINTTLNNLPKGYDTTLGTLFKDSEMLSMGEWQRMALARSFYNDAQVVILDEPTSSMDAFTEERLIKNFKTIVKNKTAIIVSHRLSTIHLADRVIVLDDHKLAEEGSPNELMLKKGIFYDMVMATKYTIN